MIELDYEDIPNIIAWAAKIIGVNSFMSDACAFGVRRRGKLVAAVIYDCFSECDCNIHVASDGGRYWLTRKVLIAAFGYPFIERNMRRVTALVPAKKTHAIRFDKHLGFKFEGFCPDAMPDDDIVVLGMTRKECRFIPPEYRK